MPGTAGRGTVDGPSTKRVDFTMTKNIRFGESVQLQLRGEAFNIFNTTNFRTIIVNVTAAELWPGDCGARSAHDSAGREIEFLAEAHSFLRAREDHKSSRARVRLSAGKKAKMLQSVGPADWRSLLNVKNEITERPQGEVMTNEEMQKAMEFILEHQAQIVSENRCAGGSCRSRLKSKMKSAGPTPTRDGPELMRDGLEQRRVYARCCLSPKYTNERSVPSGEKIGALSETGRATDERLNALINIVERHISEGRNGKP